MTNTIFPWKVSYRDSYPAVWYYETPEYILDLRKKRKEETIE